MFRILTPSCRRQSKLFALRYSLFKFNKRRGRAAGRGNYGHSPADQIRRQRRHAIVLALQPVVLDRHVVALDVAGFAEALPEFSCLRLVLA